MYGLQATFHQAGIMDYNEYFYICIITDIKTAVWLVHKYMIKNKRFRDNTS